MYVSCCALITPLIGVFQSAIIDPKRMLPIMPNMYVTTKVSVKVSTIAGMMSIIALLRI